MTLNKNFLKQIRIYKTFKFSLYRASSFEIYKKVILIAFALKTFKESVEYLNVSHIDKIKSLLDDVAKSLSIRDLEWNKFNFFLGREIESFMEIELIIDIDLQNIYDIFKRFDRVKNLDEFIEERKEFFNKLCLLENKLFLMLSSLPKEKTKKVKRFKNFLEKLGEK